MRKKGREGQDKKTMVIVRTLQIAHPRHLRSIAILHPSGSKGWIQRRPPSQRRRPIEGLCRTSLTSDLLPGRRGRGCRQQRFDPVVHLDAIVFGCSGSQRRSNAAASVATTIPLTAANRINNQPTFVPATLQVPPPRPCWCPPLALAPKAKAHLDESMPRFKRYVC